MKPRPTQQIGRAQELFRAKLTNIINMGDQLVRLAGLIDWPRLEAHFAPYHCESWRPGPPTRLAMGLRLLMHTGGVSDEAVYVCYGGGAINIGAAPL